MSTKRKKKHKKDKGAKKQKGGGKTEDESERTESFRGASDEEGEAGKDEGVQEETIQVPNYASLSLREIQEPEAKSEMAADAKRQQQFSLASSLTNRRFLDQQMIGNASSSLGVPQQQQALWQNRLSIAPASFRGDERHHFLLESLASAESELRGQRDQLQPFATRDLSGQREQPNLSDEMFAQRQLAASAGVSAPSSRLGGLGTSLPLEDRLSALRGPTLQGIHRFNTTTSATADTAGLLSSLGVGGSASLSDMSSTLYRQQQHNFSQMASSLRGFQPHAQSAAMPSSLDMLRSQNLPDFRAALQLQSEQSGLSSTQQLLSQNQSNADSHAMLQLLAREQNLASRSPPLQLQDLSDAPLALRMQLLLEQRRQDMQQLSAASVANAGIGSVRNSAGRSLTSQASPSDQRLLEIMLEEQHLQNQLLQELQEQQRRQQQQEYIFRGNQ